MGDPHPYWADIADEEALRALHTAWRPRRPGAAWDALMFQMLSLERFLRVWFSRDEAQSRSRYSEHPLIEGG